MSHLIIYFLLWLLALDINEDSLHNKKGDDICWLTPHFLLNQSIWLCGKARIL